jgi:hypothetical protein
MGVSSGRGGRTDCRGDNTTGTMAFPRLQASSKGGGSSRLCAIWPSAHCGLPARGFRTPRARDCRAAREFRGCIDRDLPAPDLGLSGPNSQIARRVDRGSPHREREAGRMSPRSENVRTRRELLPAHRSAINAPSRIRTCGLLLRRESLYPTELSGPRVSLGRYCARFAASTPTNSGSSGTATGWILPISAQTSARSNAQSLARRRGDRRSMSQDATCWSSRESFLRCHRSERTTDRAPTCGPRRRIGTKRAS